MASDLTWFEVENYAPELTGKVNVVAQDFILGTVNQIISIDAWGDTPALKMARVLWACHMATLELRRGQAGTVTSQSMGGISESYGMGPLSTSFLSTTSYGQAYLTLAKTRAFRAGFTTGMVKR